MRCIDLITVVLAGVVRSRDHDTRRGVQIAGRKRHSRHRHQDGPDIDLDAIGREHSGGHFCKHIALDAAVVADGHRWLCKVLFQIIGQTLRCLCHSIDVHAVGACADDAAQTARAKGKVTVKRIFDFGIIQRFQFSGHVGVCGGLGQPALIFLFNIHFLNLLHPEIVPVREGSASRNPPGQRCSLPYRMEDYRPHRRSCRSH